MHNYLVLLHNKICYGKNNKCFNLDYNTKAYTIKIITRRFQEVVKVRLY